MNILQALILGIVQGLTEFLPVSSSGHLVLLQNFFGEIHVGFDVVVHMATLLAILVYFYKDIIEISRDFFSWKTNSVNFKIGWYILLASIPVAFVGWFYKMSVYSFFYDLRVLVMGFFITGMFLFTASFVKPNKKINSKNAFLIGLAQAISLVPGISRSGSTVSTGILSGIKREEAVRFSFLLAIPALIGASFLNIGDMRTLPWNIFVSGFFTAFFSGLFAIFIFVKHLKLKRFRWFAFYCWFMAIVSFILWQVL